MTEWIAVEERLPEPGRIVDFVAGGKVLEGYVQSGNDYGDWYLTFSHPSNAAPIEGVTHWAPKRKPPGADAAPSERTLLEEALSAAVDYIEAQMGDTEERQRQAWKAYRRAMDRLERAGAARRR